MFLGFLAKNLGFWPIFEGLRNPPLVITPSGNKGGVSKDMGQGVSSCCCAVVGQQLEICELSRHLTPNRSIGGLPGFSGEFFLEAARASILYQHHIKSDSK